VSSTSPRWIARQRRFGGGKGEGLDARRPGFLPGQSAEPVPDRLLRPDAHSELDDFPDCHAGPSAPPPSCRSFRLRRRLDQLARTARGICAASLLIPFSLPFLTHSISRPFLIRTLQMRVLSPSPTPFKFRGTQSFPLTHSSHGCEGVSGKLGGAAAGVHELG
jgi:hypothetical protein